MEDRKNIVFSIIIPVYNVEDYLAECVESVWKQTFGGYEIILVDDGSTDGSGALCDDYAQKDGRIRVRHQENQGLSAARNTGLEMAVGEYILFLDSDDFYPQPNFLEGLDRAARGRDLVLFNYARYTDRLLKKMIDFPDGSSAALWLELAERNAYQSSAWSKAVKRSVLLENDITFERGALSEDIEWSAKVQLAAKSVALAPECVYAYRVRQGSITKTVSPRHVEMQIRILSRLAAELPRGEEDVLQVYRSYVAFQYCTLMINGRLSRPAVSGGTLGKIRDLAWLLQYDRTRIVKLIHAAYRILGFDLTSWLLLVYFKLFCK